MEKLYFKTMDVTVEMLDNWESKGKLITNPDYQRDYVYTNDRASQLIESALMLIPLPTIYLCEEENSKNSIIDGQQRIVSFLRFVRNEYSLVGLSVMEDLHGKYYKDLDEEYQKIIDETTFRVVMIQKESADSKYDIFERLNRGAVTLKEQELRNCVFRGSYNNLINELAYDKLVKEMFINENKRMWYQETILRFFAFRDYFGYKTNQKKHLNEYMKKHQYDDELSIKADKEMFKRTLSIVCEVLGKKAFVTIDYEKKQLLNKFSSTFYDSIMIAFSNFDRNKLISHADEIRNAIDDLKYNNDEYHIACYAGTFSRDRVIKRIRTVIDILFNILGDDGVLKEKRAFPEEWKQPLASKQNNICPLCGNKLIDLSLCEIDHIDPYSNGGKTSYENAQVVHMICNRHKSNRTSVDSIIGRPVDNQKVISLSDNEIDVAGLKPDTLIYKNRYLVCEDKNFINLAKLFFELLRDINCEKIEELADRPYKFTAKSKEYISRTSEGLCEPYEIVDGIYVQLNGYGGNRLFALMKDLCKEFDINSNLISVSFVSDL